MGVEGPLLSHAEVRARCARAARVILDACAGAPARHAIAISGETGSGKSTLAAALRPAVLLPMDDYYRRPPRANHAWRTADLSRVGPPEVDLPRLDADVRAWLAGAATIERPVIGPGEALSTRAVRCPPTGLLVVEGTWTWCLSAPALHVFIDRDFRMTESGRRLRAKEVVDDSVQRVNAIEHGLMKPARDRAHVVLDAAFRAQVIRAPGWQAAGGRR